jgi:hypothetical protein
MALFRNQLGQSGKASGPYHLPRAPVNFEGLLSLWEFLAREQWEGGEEPREPGTAMIFYGDGRAKGMLNDKAQGLVAFTTLNPLDDVLLQMDCMVADPGTDWRRARTGPPPRR